MIQEKTTEDLRRMTDEDGLILQGCGGDLQEWVDGINDLLTQEGILLNGTNTAKLETLKQVLADSETGLKGVEEALTTAHG